MTSDMETIKDALKWAASQMAEYEKFKAGEDDESRRKSVLAEYGDRIAAAMEDKFGVVRSGSREDMLAHFEALGMAASDASSLEAQIGIVARFFGGEENIEEPQTEKSAVSVKSDAAENEMRIAAEKVMSVIRRSGIMAAETRSQKRKAGKVFETMLAEDGLKAEDGMSTKAVESALELAEAMKTLDVDVDIAVQKLSGLLLMEDWVPRWTIGGSLDTWNAVVPERLWIVKNLIPSEGVTILSGIGSMGKSRLGWQFSVNLAAGRPDWLGPLSEEYGVQLCSDVPKRVLYVTWEDDADEFIRRFQSRARRTDGVGRPIEEESKLLSDPAIADNLFVMEGRKPLWAPKKSSSGHTSTQGEFGSFWEYLLRWIDGNGVEFLILDSRAAVYASNENDRGLVRDFLTSLSAASGDHGFGCMVVSHPAKDKESTYAGSTDWVNAPRSCIHFGEEEIAESKEARRKAPRNNQPAKQIGRRLHLEKANYSAKPHWRVWLKNEYPVWRVCSEEDSYANYSGEAAGFAAQESSEQSSGENYEEPEMPMYAEPEEPF